MEEVRPAGNMDRRKKLIAAAAVLAATVFLIGFLPQYEKARALRKEASASRERIEMLEGKLRLGELRDLMGLVYLETNRKNYGAASRHSTQFFNQAHLLTAGKPDPGLAAMLQEIQQQRDSVTAGLAKGDLEVRTNLEEVLNTLYESTGQY